MKNSMNPITITITTTLIRITYCLMKTRTASFLSPTIRMTINLNRRRSMRRSRNC